MMVINRLKFTSNVVKVPFRCGGHGHGPNHWSVLKKKKTSKDKALEHFDDFYATVYKKLWPDIRTALLAEESKYVALVNNYGDTERIIETLESTGAINLRNLYKAQRRLLRSHEVKGAKNVVKNPDENVENLSALELRPEVESVDHEEASESDEETEIDEVSSKPKIPTELLSIANSDSIHDLDFDRIVDPSSNVSYSSLYQYIPATKIKGMEDYVSESKQFEHYRQGSDFAIEVQKQRTLNFPEHLKIYTYEEENDTKFPFPRKGITGVLDYYLMDGGSILPVLALDLRPNDDVLDMCAAPGGKSLVALQTLMPGSLVANDHRLSRTNRIHKVIDEYLNGMGQWEDKLFVTQNDARYITEQDMFNKILVDVPCTTDRHVLHEDDNNIFKSTRIKERLQLPELQTEILLNALKIVRPGGTVVYSTCSLSPIQNDGVVQMALKKSWEETNSNFVVKNMSPSLHPLKCVFNISKIGLKYGQLVLPSLGNNFGPMYFCKIMKLR